MHEPPPPLFPQDTCEMSPWRNPPSCGFARARFASAMGQRICLQLLAGRRCGLSPMPLCEVGGDRPLPWSKASNGCPGAAPAPSRAHRRVPRAHSTLRVAARVRRFRLSTSVCAHCGPRHMCTGPPLWCPVHASVAQRSETGLVSWHDPPNDRRSVAASNAASCPPPHPFYCLQWSTDQIWYTQLYSGVPLVPRGPPLVP
mmetsp:Transcript_108681/g.188008  ORF Transcript_108681/g.188008 Transcript_108681/m.188008 type:complete len:200 (-) Transcript_108681:40-639(-)